MNILCILCVSLALLPLYLWSSGLPQLAHISFAVFFLAYILNFYRLRFSVPSRLLLCLSGLIFIFDNIRLVLGISSGFISTLPFAYLLFNAFVFQSVLEYFPKAYKPILSSLMLSALLAFIATLVLGGSFVYSNSSQTVYRTSGLFNNPNQLGYFGLCILIIFGLAGSFGLLRFHLFIISSLMSFSLVIFSLSKAAMVASFLFVSLLVAANVIYFIRNTKFTLRLRRYVSSRTFLLSSAAFLAITLMPYFLSLFDLESLKFIDRLMSIGSESDDSFSGRGYDSLFSLSFWQLIFGHGIESFKSTYGFELHSTIASFFVEYGIIVGGMYLSFVLLCFAISCRQIGSLFALSVYLPAFAYGMVHNGSRFSILYVLIAISMSIPRHARFSRLDPSIKAE